MSCRPPTSGRHVCLEAEVSQRTLDGAGVPDQKIVGISPDVRGVLIRENLKFLGAGRAGSLRGTGRWNNIGPIASCLYYKQGEICANFAPG